MLLQPDQRRHPLRPPRAVERDGEAVVDRAGNPRADEPDPADKRAHDLALDQIARRGEGRAVRGDARRLGDKGLAVAPRDPGGQCDRDALRAAAVHVERGIGFVERHGDVSGRGRPPPAIATG